MNTPNIPYWRERGRELIAAARSLSRGCVIRGVTLAAALVLAATLPLTAQTPAGAIEGRVQNAVTGASLARARVAVKGTNIVAFTDESGRFQINGVPPGPTTLRVFFTGLDEQEVKVNVNAGQTAVSDVALSSVAMYGKNAETVKLDAYTVQSTRETNAAAIAVNEQRFAGNITSVVSTDEFGTMTDSNPGEFLKYLPGIDVQYFANNITGVSVRGLGANNTEMNFDGMTTASMNAEAVGRGFEVQYATMADIARAEIRKLPLPEDSAFAIGGIINLIRRSAFEYNKRQISYQFVMRSDGNEFTTKQMDGPKDRNVDRWRPNWQVRWVEPINKNLGFAVTLGQEDTIVNTHWSLPRWNLGSTASNTAAQAAIAAGQSLSTLAPSIYAPAMNNPLNHDAPLQQGKDYATIRADWRPRPELTIGASLSGTKGWKQVADDVRYVWNAGGTPQFHDQTRTLGQAGQGYAREESPLWRDIYAPEVSTVLDVKYKSGPWELSAKGGWSFSKYQYYDTEHGFFNSTSVAGTTGLVNVPETGVGAGTSNPLPLTMEFLHDYWGPKVINAYTIPGATSATPVSTNGALYTQPVEWWNLDNVRIGGARARPGSGKEILTAAKLFAKRSFGSENPSSVQVGLDLTDRYRNRRYDYYAWRFVGADGIPDSPDDTARLMAADVLPRKTDAQYSIPGTQRISMSKLYSLYEQHPTWFRFDNERSLLRTLTDAPAYDLHEVITAPYAQFDTHLLHNRLRLMGGVRYEKAKATAHGLLTDASAAYMKYTDGSVVHLGDKDAQGRSLVLKQTTNNNVADYVLAFGPSVLPTLRTGAPIFTPAIQAAGNALRAAGGTTDTTTNLGRGTILHTQTIYTRKGAINEGENHNFYPSLHGTYNFTENLQLQFGYARTQGRLDFAGALIPNNNLSNDPVTSGDGAGAVGQLQLQNPDLKPWTADNFEARISYFNSTGGVVGFGLFTKRVKNFQPFVNTPPLSAQDIQAYAAQFPTADIGPELLGYTLRYKINNGDAQLDGAEAELRQSLNPFLQRFGEWAKGFHFNGSLSYLNRKGPNGGDLGVNRAWTGSANLLYAKRKFSARVGYRFNGLEVLNAAQASNQFTGVSVREAQNLFDVSFEYQLHRWARLFLQGTNVSDDRRVDEQRFAEKPAWANLGTSHNLGRTWAVGVTGQF
jgi:TonB-dependent receptor